MRERFELWRWRWRDDVTVGQKAALAVLLLAGVLVAGWLAADQLSTASAGVRKTTVVTRVETVDRVVTVRQAAKPVTKRVPVVRRIYVTRKKAAPAVTVVRTETAYGTRTVTQPEYVTHDVTHDVTAPARTVTEVVTNYVSTVQWRVITVVEKSKPVTVTVTASSP